MGCNFNYVTVPREIQEPKDLHNFYDRLSEKLAEEYGEDFRGYSGDLASDNGELEIKDLELEIPRHNGPLPKEMDDESTELISSLIEDHAEQWGPSIAIKVNGQWMICGYYSN